MKKVTTLVGLAFVALSATSIASAATFNYVADAAAQEKSYAAYQKTVDGITVTATGAQVDNSGVANGTAYAYLDGLWNQRPAGLGVCKTNTTNCGSDDNMTDNEKLTLSFDQVVKITQINMVNGDHFTNNWAGNFGLSIDGSAWQTVALASIFNTPITGKVFEFWNNNNSTNANKEFYISSMNVSAVPLPAAVWLFGSALLGFTAMRKNAKVAAQVV